MKFHIESEPNRPVFVEQSGAMRVELRFDEPGTPATKWVELTASEARRIAYALLCTAESADTTEQRLQRTQGELENLKRFVMAGNQR